MEKLLDQVVSALLELKIVEITVSPANVSLSQKDLEILFGKGAFLHNEKPLAQIGRFASKERVVLMGPGDSKMEVPVFGPEVKETTVYLTQKDGEDLGLDPPGNDPGNLEGAAPIIIRGPGGKLYLDKACVLIENAVYMPPSVAERYGLRNGESVKIKFETEDPMTLNDVIIRIDEQSRFFCTIGSDIARVAGIKGTAFGRIIRNSDSKE